jgi:hypothetical protein
MLRVTKTAIVFLCLSSAAGFAVELTTRQYDNHSGDVYQTVDGTIFKKTGIGYVGYLSYHEELIFLSSTEVCMKGEKYEITIFEVGSNSHYSISQYQGAEAYAKYEEICGEL